MAGAPSDVAALSDQLHLLAMLATDSVAKQGLVAVLRAQGVKTVSTPRRSLVLH